MEQLIGLFKHKKYPEKETLISSLNLLRYSKGKDKMWKPILPIKLKNTEYGFWISRKNK